MARSAIGQDAASDLIYAAVRNAEAEAERMARLTDDLLLLARSDEDRLSLRLERTYVGSLLRRSAELAGSRLAAAGATGRVEVRPGTCARVDVGRIRQAVDNLVDNALRFAPGGSVIVLAARAAGADLDIEVGGRRAGFLITFPAGGLYSTPGWIAAACRYAGRCGPGTWKTSGQ